MYTTLSSFDQDSWSKLLRLKKCSIVTLTIWFCIIPIITGKLENNRFLERDDESAAVPQASGENDRDLLPVFGMMKNPEKKNPRQPTAIPKKIRQTPSPDQEQLEERTMKTSPVPTASPRVVGQNTGRSTKPVRKSTTTGPEEDDQLSLSSQDSTVWELSGTPEFKRIMNDSMNRAVFARAIRNHHNWIQSPTKRTDGPQRFSLYQATTGNPRGQSIPTTTTIPDKPRMPYSYEELHLLRRPSPNAYFDQVLPVARRLIRGAYSRYCSTPALNNGAILTLKCIEYYLVADPGSIQNLDQFGFLLDFNSVDVHPHFDSPQFPQPSVTDVEADIAYRDNRPSTTEEPAEYDDPGYSYTNASYLYGMPAEH